MTEGGVGDVGVREVAGMRCLQLRYESECLFVGRTAPGGAH